MNSLQPVPQQQPPSNINDNEKSLKRVLAEIGIITGTAGGGLGAIIIAGYHWISTVPSVLVPFVLTAAFPFLTLLAIIYQAVVYHRQWRVMRDSLKRTDLIIDKMQAQWEIMNEELQLERSKTNPRLQITNVRVVALRADESPIFLLSIRNIGGLDAEGTLINLRVSFGHSVDLEGTMAQRLTAPQAVTIPAGQEHTYAIPWDGPMTQEFIERRNTLRISGFIKLQGESEREFCYRYYAIKGDRPQGMPEFVPCDFDTRLTKVVTSGSVRLKLEPHPPNVVTDETQKDPKEKNDD